MASTLVEFRRESGATCIRYTSVFILITLSIGQTSLGNVDAPRNTLDRAQVSFFHPPPPYSAHNLSAEQVLNFNLGVSIYRS